MRVPPNSKNLERWMTFLRPDIRDNVPLKCLAIPGAYHSVSFDEDDSWLNEDDCVMGIVAKYFPKEAKSWEATYEQSIPKQLKNGIRYFGFHVSKPSLEDLEYENDISVQHLNLRLEKALEVIKNFLRVNRGEFIILDLQSFENMLYSNHVALQLHLQRMFGGKILSPLDSNLKKLTLTKAHKMSKQILIIYRKSPVSYHFWSGSHWPIFSPDTSTQYLCPSEFLESSKKCRDMNQGHIAQCNLRKETPYLIINLWRRLVEASYKVDKDIRSWLNCCKLKQMKSRTNSKINVLLVDSNDLRRSSELTSAIVSLNQNLAFQKPQPKMTLGAEIKVQEVANAGNETPSEVELQQENVSASKRLSKDSKASKFSKLSKVSQRKSSKNSMKRASINGGGTSSNVQRRRLSSNENKNPTKRLLNKQLYI